MKPKYRIDLGADLASCEANYARLMKLLPDLEQFDQHDFEVAHSPGGSVAVSITIEQRCKYTTILEVCQQQPVLRWLPAARFKVRAYHDARMAEVIAYQRQHRLQARYDYPNDSMFQPDEKAQLNTFLGEWLSHCLRHGRALITVG